MQFAMLGSGSRGNGTVVRDQETHLLIDCGFSYRDCSERLDRLGLTPTDLSAILVTHEHKDHVNGVAALASKYNLPVYATRGTLIELDLNQISNVCEIRAPFSIDSLSIYPIVVPHDARQPVQFIFETENARFGILSDLGSLTPNILQAYRNLDGLSVEFNHDSEMLNTGPYPMSLKHRVSSDYGHLSNAQAEQLIENVLSDRLKQVIACHVSETNNQAALIEQALDRVLMRTQCDRSIASQTRGTDWMRVGRE